MLEWLVKKEESGSKLIAFLKSKIEGYSAKQIKKWIDENYCTVNGRLERFASHHLVAGDNVKLEIPAHTKAEEDISRILFEDDHLLIYNKPPGVPSDHPEFIKKIKKNLPYLALVHRLDRDTTGALIFVKTEKAYNRMLDLFKKRVIKKSYLAIVDGAPKQDHGVIDNYLGVLVRYQGHVKYGKTNKDGLHAITEWVVVKKTPEAALLRCFPKTGRTHQIRVHMSEMGHPILGDFQYSQTFRCHYRPPRYLLHAESVEFPHPETDEILTVKAPIPSDFEEATKSLFK